jgi:hypothetical protein
MSWYPPAISAACRIAIREKLMAAIKLYERAHVTLKVCEQEPVHIPTWN